MKSPRLLLALMCLALSACNPEATPEPAATAPTETALPAAASLPTEPSGTMPAVVVPGVMTSCDTVAEATIKWSFDPLPNPPKLVDVFVGTGDADLKLFVTGPTRSEATTGPWIRPGSLFVLRNHDDASELARVTVQGPKCG